MAATLDDLIATRYGKSWHGIESPRSNFPPARPSQVHPTIAEALAPFAPQPSASALDFAAIFAKLDEMTARCDALIARNGVWARYTTGGDNV
jgi:hypothetical protein